MTYHDLHHRWLKIFKPNPAAKLRLICFPFAGGGAQFFRPWQAMLPPEVELCAVQLPGRESRFSEPPVQRADELIESFMADCPQPWENKPYAVFGHSMGGLLAYEWLRRIHTSNLTMPAGLIVSARRAPQKPDTRPPLRNLPEPEFIHELQCLQGTPQEVMQSRELLDLILPVLRSDFTLCETCSYQDHPPLDCPIFAYGGLQDHTVDRDEVDAWRQRTSETFTVRMFPGHHFFIQSDLQLFFQFLCRDLHTIMNLCTEARLS